MKKALFLLTCILAISAAQARVKKFSDMPPIIPFDQLSLDNIQELIGMRDSGFIVELKKGTSVPIQFLTKTSIFSAVIDPDLVITVDKTCYLRVLNKKGYISEDLVQWKKGSKFMRGKSTSRLIPSTNKSGVTLETSVVPYERIKYKWTEYGWAEEGAEDLD